jgi:hypothetical protein
MQNKTISLRYKPHSSSDGKNMPLKMDSNLTYVAGQKEIPFFQQQQQQQQAARKFSGWFPSFNTKTFGKHGKQ